jgi:hypothetical protein
MADERGDIMIRKNERRNSDNQHTVRKDHRHMCAAYATSIRHATFVLVAVLGTLVASASTAYAGTPGVVFESPGFTLVSAHSGLCLDVPGASHDNNVVLQQLPCSGGKSQTWRYWTIAQRIESIESGKCMDVRAGSTQSGVPVQQLTCNAGTNQKWTLPPVAGMFGTYTIVSVNSGKCLDVRDYSAEPGAPLQQWDCNGNANQQWRVGAVISGTQTLQAQSSGLCLDVRDWSTEPGGAIPQWTCTGAAVQQWKWWSQLPGRERLLGRLRKLSAVRPRRAE